jgi:threonine synthase
MTRCHACQSEAIEEVDAEFMCLDCGEMQPASQDEAQNKIKVWTAYSSETNPRTKAFVPH